MRTYDQIKLKPNQTGFAWKQNVKAFGAGGDLIAYLLYCGSHVVLRASQQSAILLKDRHML